MGDFGMGFVQSNTFMMRKIEVLTRCNGMVSVWESEEPVEMKLRMLPTLLPPPRTTPRQTPVRTTEEAIRSQETMPAGLTEEERLDWVENHNRERMGRRDWVLIAACVVLSALLVGSIWVLSHGFSF
jgi:hypothetical protein